MGGQRLDDLLRRNRQDDHLPALLSMLLDQLERFLIDQRGNHVFDGFFHQFPYPGRLHSLGQPDQMVAKAIQLVLIRSGHPVYGLAHRCPQQGTPAEETGLVKRTGEGEGGRLGDDRFVQIKERSTGSHGLHVTDLSALLDEPLRTRKLGVADSIFPL